MLTMVRDTPDRRSPRDVVQAFFFADLCGYTEFTCRHGDDVGADLALSFHHRAHALAASERCHLVKSIGDAVMVRSDDCRRALCAAQRILALSALEGYPRIRAGLDVGPAVERRGDWYGSTVNTAARIAEAARPGELLLSDRARQALDDTPGLEMVGLGMWDLKGLPGLELHAAAPA
jgi:class 3 adenylate cyclase